MKGRIFGLTLLTIFSGLGLQAQKTFRIGYVDMEYILQNVPQYQEASSQLDAKVQEWKSEIEEKKREIDEMKSRLNNQRALLTRELIEEREEEIAYQEEQALDYQQKRFGPNGDYLIQKKQLVRPIQDQVFTAVREISENRNLDMVFDRTADTGMLYAAEEHDISDQVLRSINRAANRRQIDSRQDRRELETAEERTVEEDKKIAEQAKVKENKQDAREAILAERQRQRDSIKAAKQKELEERRARIIEERQRRMDSIRELRRQKDTIN
ncbi:OmpH family outer membrane protein [Autumnicola psychrophila]|uniref:OmpH family outer membrane protein n=1 Tax=Autumnicola psychrophila TaxID=3075592 RepID=A0ABU3DRB8_9FLAO|nr:OmpH family outer membrane protein [Zunongwangia sp. F225]MDT0686258.1 OmpH family outer membrane protein [Zunongwangia sp. F225]